ncbi:MAG: hypothetical protein PHE53_02260 [Thermoguttaceae bacterium]|nr:hypothetical protein [Thermoguttaceae bacterium]
MAGWIFELKVTTGSDFGLKYWLDDEKSPIINGTNHSLPVQITENGKSKDVYQWTVLSDGTVDYPSSIYVEGVNAYGKTDTLMWRLLKLVTLAEDGLTAKITDTNTKRRARRTRDARRGMLEGSRGTLFTDDVGFATARWYVLCVFWLAWTNCLTWICG